ncbi:hypothetical protein IIA16_05650, partial [bacterium]|nr:hypothetical protein [bacterium]
MRPRLRSSLGLLFLVATLVRVGLALLYPIDVAVGATMPRDGIASRHISVVRDGDLVRVRPGQVLVPEGRVVTEEDLAALRKGGLLRRSDEWQRAFADVAYFLLLAILAWMAVARHGDPYPGFNRQRPFLVTLGVGMVLLEGALSLTGAFLPPIYRLGLPLATALLVLLVLAPFRFALLYSVFLLYLLVPLLPGVTVAEIAGLLAALGAAIGIRDRHRIRLFDAIGHFILFLWLLSVLVAISLDGMEAGLVRTVPELVLGLLYAALTGVIVFALATGMLVLARRVHGLSTPDSLVESSAPDHPLLRKLAAKAPGTMAHVRAVQEIAEAGAAAVAAASGPGDPPVNPWVVRAGALFHDVGKIV